MAYLVHPPQMGEIDKKFYVDPRFIIKNTERLFAVDTIVGLYHLPSHTMTALSVEVLDQKRGITMLICEAPLKNLAGFLQGPCMLVAAVDSGKAQFAVSNLKLIDGKYLQCAYPQELVVVQRRQAFRVPAPTDPSFKALMPVTIGKEMIAQIIDISDTGLQLDVREDAYEMLVGTILTNCSLERLKARTNPFDLIIRNIRPGQEKSRIRLGCELHDPTKLNLNEFENTRNAIQNARLTRRLHFWYQDTNWC